MTLGAAPATHLSGTGHCAMQGYVERPTVLGVPGAYDPTGDAQILRKAMKGLGTDEAQIINVICKRSCEQRLMIEMAYKTSFGKDLLLDLKSELGGRLEDVILSLMTPRMKYLVMRLNKALSGVGTNERTLVDILCTVSNNEMRTICGTYYQLFGRPLEQELIGDTGGNFKRLLVSLTTANRNETNHVDPALVASDVNTLYEAGAKRFGTDESAFNMVLCTRSFPHLRQVFNDYEVKYGIAFEKVIENEFSGDVKNGLKAVVLCAKNRANYFAQRLHEAFAGFGTKDEDLIYIVVSRCEIDMGNIIEQYQLMYGKPLAQAIASETSGDYKKALLALLGN